MDESSHVGKLRNVDPGTGKSFNYDDCIKALKLERKLIDEEIDRYFHKRNVLRSMEIEKPLVEIKYPELNETGYRISPEVITTGQLRLEQAIKRARGVEMTNNDYKCSRTVWNLEND